MITSKKGFLISALLLAALVLLPGSALVAAPQWEALGPDGGDRFDLKISPLDNNTLFVYGTQGIQKSTDGGNTWVPVSTPAMIQRNAFLSLDFDPADPQTMYLAGSSKGIFKSLDNGETWNACNNGIPQISSALEWFVPINSLGFDSQGFLYAGSIDPSLIEVPGAAWIYRSGDEGDTWEAADSGIALSVEPTSQRPIVLLSKDVEGQLWAMVHGGGVFRLEQDLWVPHNGDLPVEGLFATCLAHHPTEAGHLYLGTEADWVFESRDYGTTWTSLPLPNELVGLGILPLTYFVGVDPNNKDLIIVRTWDSYSSTETPLFRSTAEQLEGGGLYFSFDGGTEWFLRPGGFFRITFDPVEIISDNIPGVGIIERTKISYTTNGGAFCVHKSVDGYVSYEAIVNGIDNILTNAIWVHSNPPAPYESIVYGGSEEGLFISDAGSDPVWKMQQSVESLAYTWSFAENFQDPHKVFYSTGNPAWSFAEQRGVYVADIACLTDPEPICPPGEQLLANVGVWKVVTTPADPMLIYALCQEDGILVSNDGGQTWDPLNGGLELPISITDLILDAEGMPLFASHRSSDGEPSDDNPGTWVPLPNEAGALYSFDLELGQWQRVEGINLAILALEFDIANNVHYAATVQGIYRSEDGWVTWDQSERASIFTDILVDATRDDIIYASSYHGIFRALNGGLGWKEINSGLPSLEVNQLAFDSVTGMLYAATSGRSVCRLVPDPVSQPTIAFDASSLEFGIVPVGFTEELTLVVANYGEADLVIQDMAPNHGDITVLQNFPQTLAPWTTLPVTVQFSPTVEQLVDTDITITSNDLTSPTTYVTVTAEGVPAIDPVPDVKVNGQDGPLSLNRGTPVTAVGSLSAGDYQGEPAELWVSVQASFGMYWYVEGSGWVPSAVPVAFSTSVIADFEFSIDLGAGLPKGDYEFRLTVDNDVDGELDPVWQDVLSLSIVPAIDPVPDVKVNGQDGPLALSQGTFVTFVVGLTAGDYLGDPAELWISAQTPMGQYWFVAGSGWRASNVPIVCITFGIVDFQYPIALGSNLPRGSYEFQFTVDNDIDGAFDPVWQDAVSLSIE